MSFDLGTALSKERVLHTEVQLEGMTDLLPLAYYPNRVDDAAKALKALQEDAKVDNFGDLEQILFSLVASWEATVGGVPVPLTSEGFQSAGVTSPFISNLIGAVIAESYAGEAKGTRLRRR